MWLCVYAPRMRVLVLGCRCADRVHDIIILSRRLYEVNGMFIPPLPAAEMSLVPFTDERGRGTLIQTR